MNVPTAIALKVGEVQSLNLPGLGTAGYVWNATVEGDTNAIAVTVGRTEPPLQPDTSIAAGSSRYEVVTIRGQEPGQARLYLVQRRPWEMNQPPLKDYRIEVTVQP